MLKNLLVYYDASLGKELKGKFEEDFKKADKSVLVFIVAYAFIVAFLTSMQNGYYTLGMVGGGLVAGISFITYKIMAGTFACRIIMATALTAIMAITIQQANGLGEGHFLFFLNFAIVIRYKDVLPLVALVLTTVVHHLTLTYCQSIGADLGGLPIMIFSWGSETDLGLLAPLIYHIVIALFGATVATSYILEGNTQFLANNKVINMIEAGGKGDLSVRIDNESDIAMVSNVNNFYDALTQFMRKVGLATESLGVRSESEAQAAATREIQAQEQQEQVVMVATSVDQMSLVTQEIAENAEQTAASIISTADASESGRKVVQTFKQSIEKLANSVEQATNTISELEKSSSQIHTIVATIRGISEQTNLLALNAAIEAARAGEQGRGFAVVADEVRVLSQRTHDSTEEISSMIDSFQSSTKTAVSTMSDCYELTNDSVEGATEAAKTFDDIASEIRSISNMATQIATAAEQQTVVTEEINRNTVKIQQVSGLFLEGSKLSATKAAELNSLSNELKNLLAQFEI
jgi:methyl-accepting chemotaxis protein